MVAYVNSSYRKENVVLFRSIGVVAMVFVVVGLGLPSLSGQTAGRTPQQELDRRVQAFFASLTSKAPKEAFDAIVKGGPLATNKGLDQIVQQVQGFDGKYGSFIEVEPIKAKAIGKDLMVLHYLYKAQRFPIVWRFVFYRAPSSATTTANLVWTLVSVNFHTKLEELELLPEEVKAAKGS